MNSHSVHNSIVQVAVFFLAIITKPLSMPFMKFSMLSAVFALIVFTSCQKEDLKEEPKPLCKLTKVTQGTGKQDDTVFMFRYDPAGLLTGIVDLYLNQDKQNPVWFDVSYTSGKIGLIGLKMEGYADFEYAKYEYNAQGKLIRFNPMINVEYTFQYGEDGFPKRVDNDRSKLGGFSDYFLTVYDKNGNLKEYAKYDMNGRCWDGCRIEYSDIPNTTGMLSLLNLGGNTGFNGLFPGSSINALIPKYMVKSFEYLDGKLNPTGITNLTYEKDDRNNVVKAVAKYSNNFDGSIKTHTWTFEYNCK